MPGDLDATYGNGGVAQTNITSGPARVGRCEGPYPSSYYPPGETPRERSGPGAAIQPDGKLIVVAQAGGDIKVARYETSGQLDTDFADDGVATIDAGGSDCARAVAVQPDGAIVVAGGSRPIAEGVSDYREIDISEFVVTRLEPDGSTDASFNDGEPLRFSLDGAGCGYVSPIGGRVHDVALQPDGAIVLAGRRAVVIRVTAGGRLDSSFGSGGATFIDCPRGAGTYWINALASAEDGKIVVAGVAGPEGYDGAVAVRLTADGDYDPSFGTEGVSVFGAQDGLSATEVAVQPDGRPVIAGQGKVIRLTRSGALDTSFSSDGIASHGMSGTAEDVAIDSTGRILATANVDVYDDSGSPVYDDSGRPLRRAEVGRLESDGSLDTTFSGDGVAGAEPGVDGLKASAILLGGGDVPVVVGTDVALHPQWLATWRLTEDGSTDAGWAGDGVAETVLEGPSEDRPTESELMGDGRVVIVGTIYDGTPERVIYVARYTSAGDLDPTFSGDGIATLDLGEDGYAGDFEVRRGGSVVVLGSAAGGEGVREPFIAALTSSGNPVGGFGEGGVVRLRGAVAGGQQLFASAEAIEPAGGGRVYVSGRSFTSDSDGRGFVARFEQDGDLDTSFARDGVADLPGVTGDELTRLDDGRIAVGGEALYRDSVVAMLKPSGRLDDGFGAGGIANLSDRFDELGALRAIAADPKNRVVFVASKWDNYGALAGRLGKAGHTAKASSFRRTEVETRPDLAVDPQGRVLVAYGDIWRLREDILAPDPTFGTDGVAPVSEATQHPVRATGVEVGTGGIYAVGTTDQGQLDLGIARLETDVPPDTTITGSERPGPRAASFTFAARRAGAEARFMCSLDSRPFARCGSPKTYRSLSPGRHRFRVYAIGVGGLADEAPAERIFTVRAG